MSKCFYFKFCYLYLIKFTHLLINNVELRTSDKEYSNVIKMLTFFALIKTALCDRKLSKNRHFLGLFQLQLSDRSLGLIKS